MAKVLKSEIIMDIQSQLWLDTYMKLLYAIDGVVNDTLLWQTVWQFLIRLNIYIPYDSLFLPEAFTQMKWKYMSLQRFVY